MPRKHYQGRHRAQPEDHLQQRMQRVMDRKSKMLATLSNILHRQSETSRKITENMK